MAEARFEGRGLWALGAGQPVAAAVAAAAACGPAGATAGRPAPAAAAAGDEPPAAAPPSPAICTPDVESGGGEARG